MKLMCWGDNLTRCPVSWSILFRAKSANNELQKDIENKVKIDEMRKEFLDTAFMS